MATLEKIRNKAGLLIIVVGVALFAFIIGDFLNSGSTYFRQNHEKIASVDGEVITIQDYQARIDEMSEVYKMQTGNSNLSEEIVTNIRESVFSSMVQEMVLGVTAEKLGLEVSAEELFDMVQGENISPVIRQMPMFLNEVGQFDKIALLNFLKAIDDDHIASYPADQQMQLLQMRNYWLFWEKNIKNQRLEEKYTNLLTKAISANKLEAEDNFKAISETSDIVYAMQNYASIPDSTVQVSKSEVEKLYNQRKEAFKQAESKVLSYISIDIVPSAEDFAKAQADIESLRAEFTASANVADLVNENSDVPYTDAFFSVNSFDEALKEFIATAEVGDVEGPLFADNKYRMFKLVDKAMAPDSVKVSHIMLAGMTDARTAELTDSLIGVLKGGADFGDIAREFSMDQAAQMGGELGWFTEVNALRGISEDFKNAVFSANVNELKTVKTLYGTHIVKVTEKTSNVQKYKVADIEMAVSPSSETYSNLYNNLNQYLSANNTQAKFEEGAQEAGFSLIKDATVTKSDQTLGFLPSSRQVVRWAFETDKGKVSDIFECNDKFIAAVMKGTVPEGYRSVASVTSQLESELRAQKKGEIIAQDLKAKNLTSVSAYAQAMNSKVDSVKFVGFNTSRISGIGVEPKVNAVAFASPQGQVSQPIVGTNGVYVLEVTGKNKDDRAYDEAEQLNTINSANSYRYGFSAIRALVDQASVIDNRIRFY
ncbi:SurA N-terminal domain-containing protein [Parabacteroides sp. PF5-6]|uniref:peptidylprolyl isomerase n=1 Tax=Parabacteroides sp. PF5-6 TaxID=1742403 RepID=UPI0024065A7B|nr:SurA N-terminal domain-containing protein [Parabacteroides sp. PF5-6]MDF9831779.1 peptidyl-prolyl cis-trans isomerase D [Parabacteroides sp. PF5-6]